MNTFTLTMAIGVGLTTHAQIGVTKGGMPNAAATQLTIPTKKVVPPSYLAERDYVWSKRVWRTIDLREKFNYPLYYPLNKMTDRWSLWHVLTEGIKSNNLTAYKPLDEERFLIDQTIDGDQFKYPVLPLNGNSSDSTFLATKDRLMNDVKIVEVPPEPLYIDDLGYAHFRPEDTDTFGNPIMQKVPDKTEIRAQDIVEYKIKEDWFFDKQRSVMDVRIIGLAPVRYITQDEQVIDKRELFWVYFPEARYILQNYMVYNGKNDAKRMSYDDLFWKRKFQSYISKETNVFDRDVNDYKVGVDALLEAEHIKNTIAQFEHDVWHY